MKKINFSNLGNELNASELKEARGGKKPVCSECSLFNGLAGDFYSSTCGCSGMGSVFADMFT